MLELNKIHFGDCLELMPQIDSGMVDMVLCDLPYGKTQNPWDSIIDLDRLWEQYDRVKKPDAAILLFGQDKFSATLMLHRKDIHRYNWIWEKDRSTGFLNANDMPLRCHEDIMVFYDKLPTYNPQKHKGKPQHGRGKNFKTAKKTSNYGDFHQLAGGEGNTDKMPRSVLYFPKPWPGIHPTQKPTDLYRYLIKTYTDEGALILDNCSGSGTIAEACVKEKRNFIAIENDMVEFEKSVMRYGKILAKPELSFDE